MRSLNFVVRTMYHTFPLLLALLLLLRLELGSASPYTNLLGKFTSKKFTADAVLRELNAVNGIAEVSAFMKFTTQNNAQSNSISAPELSSLRTSYDQYIVQGIKQAAGVVGSRLSSDYGLVVADTGVNKQWATGRSKIIKVVQTKAAKFTLPVTYDYPVVVVKVYSDVNRFDREVSNYKRILSSVRTNKYFIKLLDSERYALGAGKEQHVIISDCGSIDLSKAIAQSASQPYSSSKDLKLLAKAIINILAKIHASGLVWTDLKLDNLVFVPSNPQTLNMVNTPLVKSAGIEGSLSAGYACKAIDLESCVPNGASMIDISPENFSPEFCAALGGTSGGGLSTIGGRNRDFQVNLQSAFKSDRSGDIWALGIALLHLYTGRNPLTSIGSISEARSKVEAYVDGRDDLGINQVKDRALKKLLEAMLSIDPMKRPTIGDIQRSLYVLF